MESLFDRCAKIVSGTPEGQQISPEDFTELKNCLNEFEHIHGYPLTLDMIKAGKCPVCGDVPRERRHPSSQLCDRCWIDEKCGYPEYLAQKQ